LIVVAAAVVGALSAVLGVKDAIRKGFEPEKKP